MGLDHTAAGDAMLDAADLARKQAKENGPSAAPESARPYPDDCAHHVGAVYSILASGLDDALTLKSIAIYLDSVGVPQ